MQFSFSFFVSNAQFFPLFLFKWNEKEPIGKYEIKKEKKKNEWENYF